MDMPEISSHDLATCFINGLKDPKKRPVLILGAGASVPSLPSAYNLKVQIASNAVKQAYGPSDGSSSLSKDDRKRLEKALECIKISCEEEHITLEVLVSLITFRSNQKLDTDAMWKALCDDCVVNEFSHMVALLVKLGCVSKILTSNFDHILEEACANVGAEFQVVTNAQLEGNDPDIHISDTCDGIAVRTQICPFHGTTYSDTFKKYTGPFTATATGLAKPFRKQMSAYIRDSLTDPKRPIIVFGYSGNDHYDINPLFSSMQLDDSRNRDNWFWVVHGGQGRNVSQAVRDIFDAGSSEKLAKSNAIYGADTLSVMQECFKKVADVAAGIIESKSDKDIGHELGIPGYQYQPARSTYQERLENWFGGNFNWNIQEANDFILDLENNLAATWIVSEHYRLIQLGYDEEYAFRFAGIFNIQSTSRDVGRYSHLALKFKAGGGDKSVEFGYILEAARIYRLEMNDVDQTFQVTGGAMRTFIEQANNAIDYAPRHGAEAAALQVGLAIAYDYLGLIGGRNVTKSLKAMKALKQKTKNEMTELRLDVDELFALEENNLAAARKEASDGFEACINYASLAKSSMSASLEKLIPALTWIQVGTDNMGRFKIPGSDDAIQWLVKAIKGRERMIQTEIELSKEMGEAHVGTSKVVSVEMHFPPLWRRGGELVQQVLETQGFNTAPNRMMKDLSEERKKLVEFGYKTSEDAFQEHNDWNSAPNANFPAVYDCRVLISLGNGDVKAARRAVRDCRIALNNIPEISFSSAKRTSLEAWINNIEARIDDYLIQHHNDDTKSSLCRKCIVM